MTAEARKLIEAALDSLADAGLELRTRAEAARERDPDVRVLEGVESLLERLIRGAEEGGRG